MHAGAGRILQFNPKGIKPPKIGLPPLEKPYFFSFNQGPFVLAFEAEGRPRWQDLWRSFFQEGTPRCHRPHPDLPLLPISSAQSENPPPPPGFETRPSAQLAPCLLPLLINFEGLPSVLNEISVIFMHCCGAKD